TVTGVEDSVCGLCGVAARVAAGRGAGGATPVLAETVGRDGAAGSAHGPHATRREEPAGGDYSVPAGKRIEWEAEGSLTSGRGDAVHEPAGGVASDAEQVCRAAGYRGGDGGGQPQPFGNRRSDWVLREHAGGADGAEREPEFRGGVETGAAGDAGCLPA